MSHARASRIVRAFGRRSETAIGHDCGGRLELDVVDDVTTDCSPLTLAKLLFGEELAVYNAFSNEAVSPTGVRGLLQGDPIVGHHAIASATTSTVRRER